MTHQVLSHMRYGGDYNPDQWPESVWDEDMELMQESGVNLVSIAIFSWARIEPKPGQYDFAWLDRIMDKLHAAGVGVDLATASASPPPWMGRLHPDSLPVTQDGTRLWYGSRQQYCPTSPDYRQGVEKIVRLLAERYAQHPALEMWHINNEYACHVAECFCDRCAERFRGWLKERYNDLDTLNEAWGTAFWSQRYGEWEEIIPPRSMPTFNNPSQMLDWRRFSSDMLLECFELEKAILKEVTPDKPVTTNFMGFFKPLDYWKWAASEDIVSHDMYPDPAESWAPMFAAGTYDLMRSLGHGRPWMLMEQVTSHVQWRPRNVTKGPDQMRLWSYQAVARGANAVMFFQWRASRAGSEKFHGGMVPHGGRETRTWREVVALGQELKQLQEVCSAQGRSDVAIIFDWESWWALEGDCKPSVDARQLEVGMDYYSTLYNNNIGVDFVHPDADLSGYKVVIAPVLYQVRAGLSEKLDAYVSQGGRLVMSFFSGIADERDHVYLGGYPAPFRKILGLRVEEFAPYAQGQTNGLYTEDEELFGTSVWSDVIVSEGAKAIAHFQSDFYANQPAITENSYGSGLTYYVGTKLEMAGMQWLLKRVLDEAGVRAPLEAPANVEVIQRHNEQNSYTFLLNHNLESVTINLPAGGYDLISQREYRSSIIVDPRGVAIIRNAR
jgi:beta-galactosidase